MNLMKYYQMIGEKSCMITMATLMMRYVVLYIQCIVTIQMLQVEVHCTNIDIRY